MRSICVSAKTSRLLTRTMGGGTDMPVTEENNNDYTKSSASTPYRNVQAQFDAFMSGFSEPIPLYLLYGKITGQRQAKRQRRWRVCARSGREPLCWTLVQLGGRV